MSPTKPSYLPASVSPGRRPVLWLVALYAAALYLPFLGAGRLLTHHEGMVAWPAMRILQDGDWIVPKYASGWWLDKPPLLNWVTAAIFAISGGFSEFGARLPAALSAIGLAVLMAALARRLYDDVIALYAGLVQAVCVYALMQGRLGEIDMPLTLLIAAAHCVLIWSWTNGRYKLTVRAGLLFHLLMALAVLAKGPVAIALVGATLIGFAITERSFRPILSTIMTPGLLLFLVITVSWHAAAYRVAGQEALTQWGYNYFQRFEGEHHLGREPIWFYFIPVLWLALPCTIAVAIGAKWLWRDARKPEAHHERYLWMWFFAGFVALSLSAFKHKHYSLPILPPLSVFAALVIRLHLARVPKHAPRFYAIIFGAVLIGFLIVNGVVMPKRDPRKPLIDFVQAQTAQMPSDAKLYVVGLGQHPIYPYLGRPCVFLDDPESVRKAVEDPKNQPMLVWTLSIYLDQARKEGMPFELVASEPENKKTPAPKRLVLVRAGETASTSEPSSHPASQP